MHSLLGRHFTIFCSMGNSAAQGSTMRLLAAIYDLSLDRCHKSKQWRSCHTYSEDETDCMVSCCSLLYIRAYVCTITWKLEPNGVQVIAWVSLQSLYCTIHTDKKCFASAPSIHNLLIMPPPPQALTEFLHPPLHRHTQRHTDTHAHTPEIVHLRARAHTHTHSQKRDEFCHR